MASNAKCCASTRYGDGSGDTWFNIKFLLPVVVQTVYIVNREGGTCGNPTSTLCADRIIGNDLYVGDDPKPYNNVKCNANPTTSGYFYCGGLVGTYLGLYKNTETSPNNICQIRAYSWKPNNYSGFTYKYSTLQTGITSPCSITSNMVIAPP